MIARRPADGAGIVHRTAGLIGLQNHMVVHRNVATERHCAGVVQSADHPVPEIASPHRNVLIQCNPCRLNPELRFFRRFRIGTHINHRSGKAAPGADPQLAVIDFRIAGIGRGRANPHLAVFLKRKPARTGHHSVQTKHLGVFAIHGNRVPVIGNVVTKRQIAIHRIDLRCRTQVDRHVEGHRPRIRIFNLRAAALEIQPAALRRRKCPIPRRSPEQQLVHIVPGAIDNCGQRIGRIENHDIRPRIIRTV